MPDAKHQSAKGKLKVGVLKLKRETLRVLDAEELKQAQGGPGSTGSGFTCHRCTHLCTKRC